MSLDENILSFVVRRPSTFADLQKQGIDADFFDDEFRDMWRYLARTKRNEGHVPSRSVVKTRFPDFEWYTPQERDLPALITQLKQRKKWQRTLDLLDDAAKLSGSPESVDEALAVLQRNVNSILTSTGSSHLVDLFSKEETKKMLREIRNRKFGGALGIPTGLKRIDERVGGLMQGRMITVIGRTGLGKTWINLLFVAHAVLSGHKVILYPLEMTLTETAFRLYTIFSQEMFGASKVIKNNDLMMGHVTKKKIVRFLHALEDKFSGQLLVADVGSLSDPYTIDRIDADVETNRPDMFWVDYITLLKAPANQKGDDYSTVRYLSSGVKTTATRWRTVGGASAQVNREALRVRAFIPRLEHIAYGDSIGHDADQVVSINRRGNHLYYSMVKNRHGPEIPTTRVRFNVDEGDIAETEDQGSEEDDD